MDLSIEQIAQAFSGHRFAEVYPHFAQDVQWVSVGGSTLHGRDAVIEACEQSSEYLSQVTTEFRKFRTVVGSDAVVVDTLAEYVDGDKQSSVVASCDIYDFVSGELEAITSYTVEVGAE
jgi:limonene-1,2-epoxide hydrolase